MQRAGEEWLRIPADAERGAGGEVKEIEEDIIGHLVALHDGYCGAASV